MPATPAELGDEGYRLRLIAHVRYHELHFQRRAVSLLLGLPCCTHRTHIPFKARALKLFVAAGTTRHSPAILLASLTCYRQ